MIPAPFEYVRADRIEQAHDLLAEHGDEAKLLAGGHSLLPMMKLRLARPTVLIDLASVDGLDYVRLDGDVVAVGAMTTHAHLVASTTLAAELPLLVRAASLIGDPQVRHRGTIGGSLMHADPAADLPVAVLAADAALVLQGTKGRREVPADDFFTGFFETAASPDEILVEIRLPRRPDAPWGYEKFVRRSNDWAIVGVATIGGRVALANMGPTPLRAAAAESALRAGSDVLSAARSAAEGTEPVADLHADPAFRRHLAQVLTARALQAARGHRTGAT